MKLADDLAKFLLRVTLGVLMLFHGVAKVIGGSAWIVELMEKTGLPSALGYFVYVGEVVAPLLLIVGLWTRGAAAIIAINMVVAVFLVHMGELFVVTSSGGWALELQAFYFVSAVAVMLLGAGRFSAGGAGGRWN